MRINAVLDLKYENMLGLRGGFWEHWISQPSVSLAEACKLSTYETLLKSSATDIFKPGTL